MKRAQKETNGEGRTTSGKDIRSRRFEKANVDEDDMTEPIYENLDRQSKKRGI